MEADIIRDGVEARVEGQRAVIEPSGADCGFQVRDCGLSLAERGFDGGEAIKNFRIVGRRVQLPKFLNQTFF